MSRPTHPVSTSGAWARWLPVPAVFVINGGTVRFVHSEVDYKVRILNGGTEAVTRVLIESMDGDGTRWWTVGVSENIIDASFQALMDSIVYKLMKNRELAGQIAAE